MIKKLIGIIMVGLGIIGAIALLCTIYLFSKFGHYALDPFILPIILFTILNLFIGFNIQKKWILLPVIIFSMFTIGFVVWSIWIRADIMEDNLFLMLFRSPAARILLLIIYSIFFVIMTKEMMVNKNK